LIDFVYKDTDDVFHAFQATVGATHTANVDAIVELEESVGDPGKLRLYYVVPSDRFPNFSTDPVNPRKPVGQRKKRGRPTKHARCKIFHVMVSPDAFLSSLPRYNVSG
jgi:hypothetical protein